MSRIPVSTSHSRALQEPVSFPSERAVSPVPPSRLNPLHSSSMSSLSGHASSPAGKKLSKRALGDEVVNHSSIFLFLNCVGGSLSERYASHCWWCLGVSLHFAYAIHKTLGTDFQRQALRKRIENELSRKRTVSTTQHSSRRRGAKPNVAKGTVAALKPSPALTVPDTITVAEASQLCAAKRTDCVLVVDDEEGLSGIFTAKDLAYRVRLKNWFMLFSIP